MYKYFFSILLAAALASPLFAATWNVDPAHTVVGFNVKHMMVSTVRGTFDKFTGQIITDDKNPAALSLLATIEATSVDTRNEMRDNHLRSADFFDVANHPQITFKSTKSVQVAPGTYKVTGDLTMRGVTKEITLDLTGLQETIKDAKGGVHTGASATGTINRKDFGLNWNKALEAGGVLVSDDVQIALDVELVKADTTP
jgi:polyisoprenoid-binding protein YceI